MSVNNRSFRGIPYVLVISGFALATSLALIIFLHSFDSQLIGTIQDGKITIQPKSIWLIIGEHVATAIFILGIWHTLDQLLVKKEFNSEVISHFEDAKKEWGNSLEEIKCYFATAKHDTNFGLVATYHDANQFGFDQMIENSHKLICVMADGYSWIGRHTESFMNRFQDKSKETTFIFVHPDSDIIPVLSRKIGLKDSMYRDRIILAAKEISRLASDNKNIKILGHSLINCHAVYLADKNAVFAPYFLSSQRRVPPIITLKDAGSGSFFQKLHNDVGFLERESAPIDISKYTS